MLNILQDYYEAKLALDILAKEVEEKKQAVIGYLSSLPDNKASIAGAKFHLKKNFIYEFSHLTNKKIAQIEFELADKREAITLAENFIKGLKAEEIENGSAKLLDTKYIPVMTIVKEKTK